MSWAEIKMAIQKGWIASKEELKNYFNAVTGGIVHGNTTFNGSVALVTGANGDEGGEVYFKKPPNSNLLSDIIVDTYRNSFRIIAVTAEGTRTWEIQLNGAHGEILHTGNIKNHALQLNGGGVVNGSVSINGKLTLGNNIIVARHIDGNGADGINDLYLNYSNPTAKVIASTSGATGEVLTRGNSRPVIVSATAPTDTTAVWIVPS